ncbi:MAG: hypothetical protein FJ010_00580 [Chloroflexi bacterium]|nr:hypothetical protein [Chloroflexota bacterium]
MDVIGSYSIMGNIEAQLTANEPDWKSRLPSKTDLRRLKAQSHEEPVLSIAKHGFRTPASNIFDG